ncbi:MAG: hypothetical protein LBH10_05695 [Burkholderiaceae bacterium]|jgi:hypothetical protein|nr:hypothetical protein [Burkholderiaceae bacterium]
MQTCVQKGRNGWEAKTTLNLGENQVLSIRTSKSLVAHGGPLDTTASVASVDEHGTLTHVIDFGLGWGDYSATVLRRALPRVTEKSVREQQETALASLEQIKARVARHYAEQARLNAAQHAAA